MKCTRIGGKNVQRAIKTYTNSYNNTLIDFQLWFTKMHFLKLGTGDRKRKI
jgi:hypothetical protein